MKLYQIVAHITRKREGNWICTEGLPTFYLRDDMQGITNADDAERIARQMIARLAEDSRVDVIGVAVSVSQDFDPAVIGA